MPKNINTNNMEQDKVKWKSRRKMAWMSLISMITVTFVLIFFPIPVEKLKIIGEFIVYFYFAMTSIIGAYMGVTTWAHIKGTGNGQ